MIKGLVSVGAVLILWGVTLTAGPLEVYVGGGPSAASLDEINAVILQFNTLIELLNETFELLPAVEGTVEPLDQMGSGIAIHAGERAWLSDRLGLGGTLEVFHSVTSTAGTYESSETSEISIALACTAVGLMLGGRYEFLDAGVVLSIDLGIGYTYASFSRAITFQVPPEYPDAIAGLPPEGESRYSGFAPAVEAGLTLSFTITDWLKIGSSLSYRLLSLGAMVDSEGNALDLDGNGTTEKVDLGGITVGFTFSILIDLSQDGEKE